MATREVEVRQATAADIELLVPLFDAYRQFYRHPSAPDRARRFLLERLERQESVILLALAGREAIGFTQLYPSFSSVSMARLFILNDLFVTAEARRLGAGAALLHSASEYGRSAGAVRLVLTTEITNTTAQGVYERLGWTRDTEFYSYQLAL